MKVIMVLIKYRNKDLGGAERKLLDPYLGNWVYVRVIDGTILYYTILYYNILYYTIL